MKKFVLVLSIVCSTVAMRAQTPQYGFRDESKSVEERVEDLLGRLTVEQKVAMMMKGSKGVDSLGVDDYNWWSEALHGVARAGLATVFPQAIALAATFDPEQQLATFAMVSDEARAKYNRFKAENTDGQYRGLSFWTPNINIFRDPRWGRGQETYGEDPYLTATMGLATVKGLQGDDPRYIKTHACAKHFAVHSGPESTRHSFDVAVSETDLWETYLYAFERLVCEGNVREVMCAYQRFEGKPCCGSDRLLVDILRNRWHYDGLVVSDCGAIDDFYVAGRHQTHPDAPTASSAAVLAGTDLECGKSYSSLVEGVSKGLIDEKDIDRSLRRVLRGRFELGMFDNKESVPWSSMPYSVVDCDLHRSQALRMAHESIVLLQNDNNLLPLDRNKVRKIAVVGPNADDPVMMWGNYNGTPSSTVTILDGICTAFPDAEVSYERGCDLAEGFVDNGKCYMVSHPRANLREAMTEVKRTEKMAPIASQNYSDESLAQLADRVGSADVIIFVGGLSPSLEGEQMTVPVEGFAGGDRERIELPAVQSRMLATLRSTGKPVVFVLCTGSAVALADDQANYDALLCAWYGGQAGGTAVADVLTGDYNPSGRLPVTFYRSTSQLPDFSDYAMVERTYRYMTQSPLYPFGYGLSYTRFDYSDGSLSANRIRTSEGVKVAVTVTNNDTTSGDEVVQVYLKRLNDSFAPVKSLKGFKRIHLDAGQSAKVEIELPASAFEFYNERSASMKVAKGDYEVMFGSSSDDSDLTVLKLKVV